MNQGLKLTKDEIKECLDNYPVPELVLDRDTSYAGKRGWVFTMPDELLYFFREKDNPENKYFLVSTDYIGILDGVELPRFFVSYYYKRNEFELWMKEQIKQKEYREDGTLLFKYIDVEY